MADLPGLEVDVEEARAWVRHQLEGMSLLLQQVSARVDDFGSAHLLVSPRQVAELGLVDLTLDNQGRLVSQAASGELARSALVALGQSGARTFLVEDELAAAVAAAGLLRRGSSGYPCDALVSAEAQDRLGLDHGADLTEETVDRVAASAMAVLTSVWDDETYVLLWDDRGPASA